MLCLSVCLGVLGCVGESWLAIKDSLTHRPSSQGWASVCPLGSIHVHILPCMVSGL